MLLNGQTTSLDNNGLRITQLTPNTYVHTCKGNNGLIYIYNYEAVVVSTPESEEQTQCLIDWIKNEKKTTIVA
ncbi:hypothetical protein NBRC110019_16430 [Neptunitalea chrysea]|uniref:Uncharacterized protein n=2 Tax=Neptunitalea chrysea TaxID=1647581 RepID=A0A9W6B870_9FLAO|nr:hypothetical protein NBRC110019_16430 [Neptunitalea chrysea]